MLVQVDPHASRFYQAAGGEETARALGIPADKDKFAQRMDQMITDDLHPEAYRNVETVTNPARAGHEIGDSQQVGMTATYKGDHWQSVADDKLRDATDDDLMRALAIAEDERSEGMRQITKQYGNQVENRHRAMTEQVQQLRAEGKLPASYDDWEPPPVPKKLEDAMAIMDRTKSQGVAPVDVEIMLRDELQLTTGDVSRMMGDYIHTMEAARPAELVALQRSLG